MHPDDVVIVQLRPQAGGKALVDMPVALFIAAVEHGKIKTVVQDRPKRAIGIARVKFVVVRLGHVQLDHLDLAASLDLQLAEGSLFRNITRPAEPDPAGRGERVHQGNSQAAGTSRILQWSHSI